MVAVPPGTFEMGAPSDEKVRRDNEGPVRRVTIAEPFAVGVYEVTFDEWDACARGRRMQGAPRRQGLGAREAPGHQRELEGCKDLCRVALVGDREGIPVVVGGGVGVRRPGGDARARSTSTVRCRRLGRTTRFSSRTGARPLPLARSRATGSDFTMCTGTPGSGWRTAGIPITRVRLPTGARGRRAATAASVSFAAVPGATDRGFSDPRRASGTHSTSGAATSAFALPAPSRHGEGTDHNRMVRLRGSTLACKPACLTNFLPRTPICSL